VARDERDPAADAQMHLLRVLGGLNLPGTKDELARLDEAARELRARRREAVAKQWPAVAGALGDEYEALFDAYATKADAPTGGTQADARAFLRQLRAKGKLPDQLSVTLLRNARSIWPMRMARLRERRGVALAVKVPGIGVKVWSIAFGGKGN